MLCLVGPIPGGEAACEKQALLVEHSPAGVSLPDLFADLWILYTLPSGSYIIMQTPEDVITSVTSFFSMFSTRQLAFLCLLLLFCLCGTAVAVAIDDALSANCRSAEYLHVM